MLSLVLVPQLPRAFWGLIYHIPMNVFVCLCVCVNLCTCVFTGAHSSDGQLISFLRLRQASTNVPCVWRSVRQI